MTLTGLILSAALQFGTIGGLEYKYEALADYTTYAVDIPLYTTAEFSAQYGLVFLEGSWRTEFWAQGTTDYRPTQMAYEIGAGLDLDWLKIGWRHVCFHPILTYATTGVTLYEFVPPNEGGYEEVYARVEIEVRF